MPAPAVLERLDALIAPYASDHAPGVVAGVRFPNGEVWRRGAGLASVQSGLSLATETPVRIGSITKTMLAGVLFSQAAEGRVNLSADATAFVRDLPPIWSGVSLRALTTHVTGLWCNVTAHYLANGPAVGVVSDQEAFAAAVRQSRPNHPLGAEVSYSNSAYLVLSRVVEAVEGAPLEAVLQQRLFGPLGMTRTALVRQDVLLRPGLADSHVPFGASAWLRGQFPLPVGGEGGVVSTVDDMLTWLAALGASAAVPPAVLAALNQPVRLIEGRESNFRHGIMWSDWADTGFIHHDGGVIGGAARALKALDHGLDLVVIANRSDVPIDTLSRALLDAAAGREPPQPCPPEPLAGGFYAYRSGKLYTFDSGRLDVLGAPTPLRRLTNGALSGSSAETANLRIHADGAQPSSIQVSAGAGLVRFDRLPERKVGKGAPPLGRWRAPDLGAEVAIESAGEGSTLTIRGERGVHRLALRPLAPDLWQGRSLASVPHAPIIEAEHAFGRRPTLFLSTQRLRRVRLEPA